MRNTLIHRMREELRLESQCKAKGCEALFVKWQHHVARHQEYKARVAIVH